MYHRKLNVFVRNEDPPGKLGVDYEHYGQNEGNGQSNLKRGFQADNSTIINEIDEELYDQLTEEPLSPLPPLNKKMSHSQSGNVSSIDFKTVLPTIDEPSFELAPKSQMAYTDYGGQ